MMLRGRLAPVNAGPDVSARVLPRIAPLPMYLRSDGVHIQWRVGASGEWTDLVPIGDLAASVEVGDTTTLPPGSPATVVNAGTEQAAVLQFGIPEGAKGDTGAAATIAVGSTTTLPPGSPASVTNAGTVNDAILDFEIPEGEKGDKGDKGDTGAAGLNGGGLRGIQAHVVDTAGLDPATDYEAGETVGGKVLDENDIIVRASPGGDVEDGVHVAPATGAAARHPDFATWDACAGALIEVMMGDGAHTLWRCIAQPGGGTLDTDPLEIAVLETGASLPAGGNAGDVLSLDDPISGATYWRPARSMLLGNTTIHVDVSTGDDGNEGTISAPYATIARAITEAQRLDMGGNQLTIQVAAGTYAEAVVVDRPFVGGAVLLQGDPVTPLNCVINSPGSAITVYNGGRLLVSGLTARALTSGAALFATDDGRIRMAGIMRLHAANGAGMEVSQMGYIRGDWDYVIEGGGHYHWNALAKGIIRDVNSTKTLLSTPAYVYAFARAAYHGSIGVNGCTFVGSATGKRYDATNLSYIQVGGAGDNYLPGNSDGTFDASSVYV